MEDSEPEIITQAEVGVKLITSVLFFIFLYYISIKMHFGPLNVNHLMTC